MTVQLHVGDGHAGRRYYERLLERAPDFLPHGDDAFVEWHFVPGNFELHIVESDVAGSQQGRLRLGVADVESERQRLVDADVAVSPIEELAGVVRWCNVDDPWGNRLGFYQDLVRFPGRG
ncbi:MAG: VOC family protein [Chloroflexota bacterium]